MKYVYKPYSIDIVREHKNAISKVPSNLTKSVDTFFAAIEADKFDQAGAMLRGDDVLRAAVSDRVRDMFFTRHSENLQSAQTLKDLGLV